MKSCAFLKNGLLFLLFCLAISPAFSQVRKGVALTHYLFPEFIKGEVLMKNGEKHEAMLNYNALTEEMIFDNKGKKLALTDLESVDTVYIEGNKFFLLNKKFVQLIYMGKLGLYAENKCKIKDPGTPAAYGGTSQVSATDSYASYFANGQVYELELPSNFEKQPFIDYWLKKEGKMTKFFSVRQLIKLLNDQNKIVKEYTSNHEVKYEDQESLVGLIRYLDEN